MHELGLIIDVVEKVEGYAENNGVASVKKVILQVGEAFSVVPGLMKTVYRKAVQDTALEGSELELEIIEASVRCSACGREFNPFSTDAVCPDCGSDEYMPLHGKEFLIKEILVEEV